MPEFRSGPRIVACCEGPLPACLTPADRIKGAYGVADAVFARPPQVHTFVGPGVRTRSVSIRVPSMEVWLCPAIFAARKPGGGSRQSFLEIGVHGGLADHVVRGQLGHSGAVEKPAQHQDRLLQR